VQGVAYDVSEGASSRIMREDSFQRLEGALSGSNVIRNASRSFSETLKRASRWFGATALSVQ